MKPVLAFGLAAAACLSTSASSVSLPRPDRVGTLVVTLTFDAAARWANARNGAYSSMKFHRTLSFTMPLRGTYSAGSGFQELDRREPQNPLAVPNLKRFLLLHPRDLLGATGRTCGSGKTEFLDEADGMEEGDPGQPPLVPFRHENRGGGAFPSGDKTVPERDLCQTVVSLDHERKVFHLRLDGSDSNVKIRSFHNGRERSSASTR